MSVRLELGAGATILNANVGDAVNRQLDAQLAGIRDLFAAETRAPYRKLVGYLRAWTRSHEQKKDINQVLKLAKKARGEFDVLVTIGIGGSDLSARVYHDVLNHSFHNELTKEARGGAPEVYFTGDTFDPRRLRDLLDMLEQRRLLGKTLFNVISKSGRTGETIASMMIIRDRIQTSLKSSNAEAWRKQVVATSGLNDQSALFTMHQKGKFYGNTVLSVPDGVGGRYSAFSPVGLFFVAMTAGVGETPESRIADAISGIESAHETFFDGDNDLYALARWLHLAENWGGKNTLLFYNYADNKPLGDWVVQLYEESIQERGQGLNLISACGPTGNHSILNGVVGGARDKVALFLKWDDLGDDLVIPTKTGIGGELSVFEGKRMGQIQTASYQGTAEDLSANGVPNATLFIDKRDTKNLCYLMRFLMDTVAVKGRLQGLHLNDAGEIDFENELTYLQFGVEGYKERTRRIAGTM
ncbi:MAG: hypothetical protein O3A46_03830 [Candidatus Poribacteria bacterium]|nr:hypothetical protein [Candidatus Poribacteria bacterium]